MASVPLSIPTACTWMGWKFPYRKEYYKFAEIATVKMPKKVILEEFTVAQKVLAKDPVSDYQG